MEFQVRKSNRISEYDYAQNGAYFVTICTQDRKHILSHIVGDGSPVPKPYGMIAEEMIAQIPVKYSSVAVDNYVIMPDHIHLLLSFDEKTGTENPSPTLGNVIGWYKYQVTKQVNAQSNNPGEKLFQMPSFQFNKMSCSTGCEAARDLNYSISRRLPAGKTSCFFGSVSFSTPLSYFALIPSASTPEMLKLRL